MNRNLKQTCYCVRYTTREVEAVLVERQGHLLRSQKLIVVMCTGLADRRKAHFDRPVYMTLKNLTCFIRRESESLKLHRRTSFCRGYFPMQKALQNKTIKEIAC